MMKVVASRWWFVGTLLAALLILVWLNGSADFTPSDFTPFDGSSDRGTANAKHVVEQSQPASRDRSSPFLCGTVCDALTTVPLAGAELRVGDHLAVTGADGAFRISLSKTQQTAGPMAVHVAANGYAASVAEGRPGQPLQLALERAQGVSIRLIERGSNLPLTEFEVSLLPHESDDMSAARRGSRVMAEHKDHTHDAGWAWFRDAKSGQYIVQTRPTSNEHVASLPQVFAWREGHSRVEVLADRAVLLSVRVLSAAGVPVSGPHDVIVARDPEGLALDVSDSELSLARNSDYAYSFPRDRRPVVVAKATTSEGGRASLPSPSGETVSVIVAKGEMSIRAVAHRVGNEESSELVIILPPCQVVSGKVRPASFVQAIHPECDEFWRLAGIERSAGMPAPELIAFAKAREQVWKVALEADGSFRFEHVPLGDWELHVSYHVMEGKVRPLHRSSLLGEFSWWAGGEQRVELDAASLVPRRIMLTCLENGQLLVGLRIEALKLGSQRRVASGKTDENGKVSLLLEPGCYVVRCSLGGKPRSRVAVVDIGREGHPDLVDFRAGPVEVRLTAGAKDVHVTGRLVRIRAADIQWTSSAVASDERGIAAFADVAIHAGQVFVEVQNGSEWTSHVIASDRWNAQVSPRTVVVAILR